MRPEIRCDGKSWKIWQNFGELNWPLAVGYAALLLPSGMQEGRNNKQVSLFGLYHPLLYYPSVQKDAPLTTVIRTHLLNSSFMIPSHFIKK